MLQMNSTEFLAIRKLQKERGASDSQVAGFLDLLNAGDSLVEATWDLAVTEQIEREADDQTHLAYCIERDEAKRRGDHEFEVPF